MREVRARRGFSLTELVLMIVALSLPVVPVMWLYVKLVGLPADDVQPPVCTECVEVK